MTPMGKECGIRSIMKNSGLTQYWDFPVMNEETWAGAPGKFQFLEFLCI